MCMCVQHVCIIFACLFILYFFQGVVTNALITQKGKDALYQFWLVANFHLESLDG